MKKALLGSTLLMTAVAFGLSVPTDLRAQDGGTAIGGAVPDFTLPDTYGKDHSISDYHGQYVVLEWLNYDCPSVKKHYNAGNMQMLQEKYTGEGVVWLAIVSSAPGRQTS